MTTASPNTTPESIGFSTASDFFDPETDDSPPYGAVSIVWYDQATPIYACPCHEEHLRPLRFEGTETVENYEETRKNAYLRLFEESPTCDVCTGDLPEKVDL